MNKRVQVGIALALLGLIALAQTATISAQRGNAKQPEYDIVQTQVRRQGTQLTFTMQVSARAGGVRPTAAGKLAGSSVYSYVWPTSLDSSSVGFEAKQGVLALAATSHPDFDDTPLFDENNDGNPGNDGDLWHSHWVVLVPDDACGKGNLKVRDIPQGTTPKLPATWPRLPILIDSPGYEPSFSGTTITVRVPLKELGFPKEFAYDGVTAALRVNADVHSPLLCVVDVFDVASNNLSLPGKVRP
ncbi:MAG: hypothetical protein SFU83_13235 [Meiothermus sp.]|nr:hypothetical protein [Meiothermus sp.]